MANLTAVQNRKAKATFFLAPGHFNSGVFVLEPSTQTYQELLRLAPLLRSYNQGDQVLTQATSHCACSLPRELNYALATRAHALLPRVLSRFGLCAPS